MQNTFVRQTDLIARVITIPCRVIERDIKYKICNKIKEKYKNDAFAIHSNRLSNKQKDILSDFSDITIDSILLTNISLGFWTMFFERKSNPIWWNTLRSIFKIPQKDRKREFVNGLLQKFRKLRNVAQAHIYNNEGYNEYLITVKEGINAILKLAIYLNISFEQDEKKELIDLEKEIQEILNNL